MSSKIKRGLREFGVFILLLIAVVWGMDQFRKPTLPDDFTATPMKTITGETVNLAALSQDKPLLLYVWATWCGVCRFTTPDVDKMAKQGGNVISLAMRSGDDAKLLRWVDKKQLALPVVNDDSGALSQQWQVNVTPTFVVISKGKVVSTTTGWTSSLGMKMRLWWAGVSGK